MINAETQRIQRKGAKAQGRKVLFGFLCGSALTSFRVVNGLWDMQVIKLPILLGLGGRIISLQFPQTSGNGRYIGLRSNAGSRNPVSRNQHATPHQETYRTNPVVREAVVI